MTILQPLEVFSLEISKITPNEIIKILTLQNWHSEAQIKYISSNNRGN